MKLSVNGKNWFNSKLELAEIWILTYLAYMYLPMFSVILKNQIEGHMVDYRLLGASGLYTF